MPEQVLSNEKQPTEKPFPWRCPKCRQPAVNRVTMPYRCQRMHNDRVVIVEVPNLAVPCCSNCGEIVFDYAADEQIRAAFRTRFGSPETVVNEKGETSIRACCTVMKNILALFFSNISRFFCLF